MTYRILKSQTFTGFDVAVAAFAKDMSDWREQEKKATEHDGKLDIPAAHRWVHRKRPSADPRVMRCVNDSDVADFEIVDDRPSADDILMEKKNRLFSAVSGAEMKAIRSIVQPGKQRRFALWQLDIEASDARKRVELKPSAVKKIAVSVAASVGLMDEIDTEAEVVKQRPPADTQFLQDQAIRQAKIETITRAAAQMHSDIEDLTLDNIDAWKMPEFK